MFEGHFEGGRPVGMGTIRQDTLVLYRGGFVDGAPGHFGTYTLSRRGLTCDIAGPIDPEDGITEGTLRCEHELFGVGLYMGGLLEAQPHGTGILMWENGWFYSGDWVEGMRHGQGVLMGAFANRYEGEFVDDKIQGYGVAIEDDGRVYAGQWVDGSRKGAGVLTWPGGNPTDNVFAGGVRFEGEFSSHAEAEGTYSWADGRTFRGTVEGIGLGFRPKQGTLTDAEGRTRTVAYEGGEFVSIEPVPDGGR